MPQARGHSIGLRFRRWLASLLGRLQHAVAPPAAPARPVAEAKPPPPSLPPELIESLRRSGSVTAGRVQLIGLDKIREMLGDRWRERRDHVVAAAAQIIGQHVSAPDFWRALGDSAFLIVFTQIGRAEAELRSTMIIDRIHRHLLGEGAPFEEIEVQSVMVEVDGRIAVRQIDAMAALTEALDAEERAMRPAGPGIEGPSPQIPGNLRFRYRPMWQVRKSTITAYHCVAESAATTGFVRRDYAVLAAGQQSSLVSELDQRALRHVLGHLRDQAQQTADALPTVAVTVHCRTLETYAARTAFLKLLNEVPERLRPHLIFEIAALPPYAPESRVHQLTLLLSPFCRAVVVRVSEPDRFPTTMRQLGVASLSISIDDLSTTEEVAIEAMKRFRQAAARTACASVAHGLSTKALAAAALHAGFDIIDGEALTSARDRPGQTSGWTAEDLEKAAKVPA